MYKGGQEMMWVGVGEGRGQNLAVDDAVVQRFGHHVPAAHNG